MSSSGILHSHNGTSESLDSSDFSIINNPEESLVNGNSFSVGPVQRSFDIRNLHSTLMSASPEISLENLRSLLADAVEDNIALRQQLAQNNVRMEEQLQTIMDWHNNMTTTMSEQKLNLKEAQDNIAVLEKEKVELLSKIKELETKPKMVDCETEVSIKNNISPLSDEEVDFEIINRKELKIRMEENQLKEACSKISDMTKIIEAQKKQIELLSHSSLKSSQDKCLSDMQEQIKSLNLFIQELEGKICRLENSLQMKESELEDEKTSHSETKKMFTLVQTNYDRVTKLLQIQSKDDRGKNDEEERESDTRMYLEQIDNVTAKLMDAEERLHEQEDIVKSMTAELNLLKEDSEKIPILKAQLEVYKIDLDTANLARDAAAEEVSRLTQEKHENSYVSLCDSCGGDINMMEGSSRNKSRRRSSPQSKRTETEQKEEVYTCPLCGFGFTSLQAVANHVNDCLDKSENCFD